MDVRDPRDLVGVLYIDPSRLPILPLDLSPHPRPSSHWKKLVSHWFNWGDFLALSYCWKSDVREKDVLMDGVVVQIPKNLETILQKLRYLPESKSGKHF